MLRLIKRHLAGCEKTSETDFKCRAKGKSAKPNCPFYAVGPDPRNPGGKPYKAHCETSNESIAIARLHGFERTLYLEPDKKPPEPIEKAIDDFVATKKHKSDNRQRKCKRLLGKMAEFLKASFGHRNITDPTKVDLEKFLQTWDGKYSTMKADRELLKGFWKYCYDSDFIPKNIALNLPTIGDDRQQKGRVPPTFTHEEDEGIITSLDRCEAIFKREGREVAKQMKAFTLVQRYTGLAIGDVAKLKQSEVSGLKIFLRRKKTGEPVWTKVPPFVIAALKDMQPDSPEYFFWSGQGKLHTRTSKWGKRMQKLFVFTEIRVVHEEKTRRSGGVLKDKPEIVTVSKATPHMWRHTFVRDRYLEGMDVADIADLLGDDVATVRKYYSCFDELRREKLLARVDQSWENDPLTQRLMQEYTHLTQPA